MSSLPLASHIAMQSGVMQTQVSNSTVAPKSTKVGREGEQSRHVPSEGEEGDQPNGASAFGGSSKTSGNKGVSSGGGVKKRRKATLAQVQQRAVQQAQGKQARDSGAVGSAQGGANAQAGGAMQARLQGIGKATNLLTQNSMLSQASISYDNYDTAERGRTSNYVSSRLGNAAVVVA